jgi:hypothetical protein
VRLGGLGQLKNSMTSSGFEPATLRLVAQCLNQLCYRVPLLGRNRKILVCVVFYAVHVVSKESRRLLLLTRTSCSKLGKLTKNKLDEFQPSRCQRRVSIEDYLSLSNIGGTCEFPFGSYNNTTGCTEVLDTMRIK